MGVQDTEQSGRCLRHEVARVQPWHAARSMLTSKQDLGASHPAPLVLQGGPGPDQAGAQPRQDCVEDWGVITQPPEQPSVHASVQALLAACHHGASCSVLHVYCSRRTGGPATMAGGRQWE